MLDVRAGQRLVATGTRVQVPRAVLNHEVVRPVSRPSPATALHLAGKNFIMFSEMTEKAQSRE